MMIRRSSWSVLESKEERLDICSESFFFFSFRREWGEKEGSENF